MATKVVNISVPRGNIRIEKYPESDTVSVTYERTFDGEHHEPVDILAHVDRHEAYAAIAKVLISLTDQ